VVRFNNTFSSVVQLQCAVRQGVAKSPVFFAVYVNNLILAISSSGARFSKLLKKILGKSYEKVTKR